METFYVFKFSLLSLRLIMCERKQFLEKVTGLFFQHGAKSLTMDDIAKAFSISKKTLYTQYKNKEELLNEVLDFFLDSVVEKMKINDQKIANPIETMLVREKCFEEISKSNQNFFVRQLIKYYPALFDAYLIDIHQKVSKVMINNITKGREMGLYKKDFDAELYVKYMLHLHISTESSPLFLEETSSENIDGFSRETMIFFLRAIVTQEGAEILNKLKD